MSAANDPVLAGDQLRAPTPPASVVSGGDIPGSKEAGEHRQKSEWLSIAWEPPALIYLTGTIEVRVDDTSDWAVLSGRDRALLRALLHHSLDELDKFGEAAS